MTLHHLKARAKSLVCASPIWSECYTKHSVLSMDKVSINRPVFLSQVIECCMEKSIPRVMSLLSNSISFNQSDNTFLRKFPTPYVMFGEIVDINNDEHTALCVKLKNTESYFEYVRGFKRLALSRIVFIRDEFHEFEKLIGHSFLAKNITIKPVPEIVHLKTIVRLEGKHRKQQANDAKGIAQYVYRLASMKPGATIKLKDYKEELTRPPYSVSEPVAAASWLGLPFEIKNHHRPKRGEPAY